MKKLEGYAENPFENIYASREDIATFYGDHKNRIIRAVASGEPFGALVAPTTTASNNLTASQSSTVVSKTDLKSLTMDVDQFIDLFVTRVRYYEAIVLAKFAKGTSQYNRFFPNGLTGYNNSNKSNIIALFDQILNAATLYSGDIGLGMSSEFADMKENYISARDSQQQQKETATGTIGSWKANLAIMGDQAYDNLLAICKVHRNHPELIKQYFDVNIITYDKHPGEEETGAYEDTIPRSGSKCMNISFSPDDVLAISVNSEMDLGCYGAPEAGSPEPATLILLAAGQETQVTAAQLGAPTNRFLIIVNKDETTDGEVEIVLL